MEIQPSSTTAESEPLLARNDCPAVAETHDEQGSISDSFLKLSATAFDFLTTGISMAAVGVGMHSQVPSHLFPLTMQGLDSRCKLF